MQPFVQVSFQGKTVRSSTVVGSNPQWNESLMFPFHPPGEDFSSANLTVVSETVYFDVFDEVLTELQKVLAKQSHMTIPQTCCHPVHIN